MRLVASVAADEAAPLFKRFRSSGGEHLLVVPHSRVYDLSETAADSFDQGGEDADRLATMLGETAFGEADLSAVAVPAPQAISLNVSSTCNLSCSYCYAGGGGFGGAQAQSMSGAVARASVERLLAEADPSRPVTVGFLGGEPLRNRTLIREIVAWSSDRARRDGLDLRFSITTNGTLLTPADCDLFREHAFGVTVSVDGFAAVQDAQRPRRNGTGSFAQLAARVKPLLADPGPARVAARLTVPRGPADLRERLEAVWELGFAEAGVSPLRTSVDGSAFRDVDWPRYGAELIDVARGELGRARNGTTIRLTNLAVALKQIHAGASSPYACGAGGGYFSVSANGDWYACHRAIGSEPFRLGEAGLLDDERRRAFLQARHVHAKAECRLCWARYLCSGGCHQEAEARGTASCDVIRDWLEFCLTAYCELSTARPDHFALEAPGLGQGG